MEKHYEIVKQATELSETIKEALTHIEKQMEALKYTESLGLMQDVVIGLSSIKQSMLPVFEEIDGTVMEDQIDHIHNQISKVVSSLEEEAETIGHGILKSSVIPAFDSFQDELRTLLQERFSN
ncbi:hypothetical protein [Alkalibacillus silvisoli]|uniref:DUF8042 domain-containing protein n=1 Tax=Alkalibacillus silvisoli TaxID=392823 RepID=A0ABP3K7P0_9BACI